MSGVAVNKALSRFYRSQQLLAASGVRVAPGSGYVVQHADRNRARRRQLKREQRLAGTPSGTNAPYRHG